MSTPSVPNTRDAEKSTELASAFDRITQDNDRRRQAVVDAVEAERQQLEARLAAIRSECQSESEWEFLCGTVEQRHGVKKFTDIQVLSGEAFEIVLNELKASR